MNNDKSVLSIDGYILNESLSKIAYEQISKWYFKVFKKEITFERCQDIIFEFDLGLYFFPFEKEKVIVCTISNLFSELFESKLKGITELEFVLAELKEDKYTRDEFYLKSIYDMKFDKN